MDLRHLRCFLAVADELHFGRAARRLAMSQPPLSVAIAQLEASVGARLFERSSRGVRLTAAGQALRPRAQALIDAAQAAAQAAREAALGLDARLRIGFAGSLLYSGLPRVLARLQRDAPRLRVVLRELGSSEQLVELQHDRLDAAFVHTTRVPPGFSQIQVASQPLMACLPRGHALARRRRLGLAELAGEPFAIVSRAVSPDYHERILALCADARMQPDLRFELRHWLSVVSVVAQGLGVALVPAALRQAGLGGAVFVSVAVAPGAPPSHYDTWCLWRTDADPAGLKVFLDAVRHAAQASLQCADTSNPRVPT